MMLPPALCRLRVALLLVLAGSGFTATLGPSPSDSPAAATPPRGFIALFNGRDLDGWHGWDIHAQGASPAEMEKLSDAEKAQRFAAWTEQARKHWRVENGELINDGRGPYLATVRSFGDIELLVEYKTVPGADSGIYLRSTPQVQIWDPNQKYDPKNPHRKPHLGSGGLFNNTPGAPGRDPLVRADKPFGQWNRFRILQIGERTTVYLNDHLVVDHARMENYWNRKAPLPRQGKILLQTHGGEIRWRNLFVREIPPEEANERLRQHQAGRFRSLFNGRDLTGWTGATDAYTVEEGLIVCKPRRSGVLFTRESFSDFIARVEYRLPPGGNNGLAIRYPGKGRASTDGMCEIQLLDDDHPRYARLDPRQFNGSAYGIAAAHRGYLRPAGQWNFLEVTVRQSTVTVELNGTRILQADLSTITTFKDNQPHPGIHRREGHFGFAGHSDPVAFRNIAIQPLPPSPESR